MTYSRTELLREAQWRKCAADPRFFFAEFWRIQHPEKGAIPFELFRAQDDALQKFQTERYVLTLKARQIGWTTLVSAYAAWHAIFHDDRTVIFLSKGEREASDILKKVKFGYTRLPRWMRERMGETLRDNMTVIEWRNGSSIESLPSKQDPARGRSAYLVVVDEWAFLENPEEAWASIEPIADVGGRLIGLSTPNGWGTFFHNLWLDACKGDNLFTPIFEPWSARDDRDENWYEVKARTMPQWQLHQEYARNPDEAFLKSGNPFFDVDHLALLETREPKEGFLVASDFVTYVEQEKGALKLWEYPHDRETYVIGADVAEGLEYGDYSSAHVIRWRTHEVVAHWHGHIPPDEFAECLADLGNFYNGALIGVENNNHGLTTCKYLKDWHRYPNIFYMRTVGERDRRVTNKIGWTTSKLSRPRMLDDLAAELRDDTLHLWDKRTITELRTFVRDENGKLRGSPFDDCVMSLGIAVQMLDHCTQYAEQRGRGAPYMSLKWWEEEGKRADRAARKPAHIGAFNTR